MFPGKADLFLRKWEGNIVPKLQKMSTEKNPLVMPAGNESEGRLLCSFCQNVFLSVNTISFSSSKSLKSAIIPAMKNVIIFCVFLSYYRFMLQSSSNSYYIASPYCVRKEQRVGQMQYKVSPCLSLGH